MISVHELSLRPARPEEAAALSELALRSKAHWGYSDEFIEACRAELSVRRDQIEAVRVVVGVIHGAVVGFCTLGGEPPVGDVDGFFVEPEHIGTGVGAALFASLRAAAVNAGFTRLRIESDPNAVGFYERQGAVQTGEAPSGSIPGRTLPLLELDLVAKSH
jgi:GNAT superfamily N-acetyltransferase